MTHVLPSGGENFFDRLQSYGVLGGSGINETFPSPSGGLDVYNTYEANQNLSIVDTSGIFAYDGQSGVFSNASETLESGIRNFEIFNPYIHYHSFASSTNLTGLQAVRIPYIADASGTTVVFNPYGQQG